MTKRMQGTDFYTRDLLAKEIKEKNYEVGEYTYGNPRVLDWGEGKKLVIGKYCSIAENVIIFLGGNHRTDWVTTYPFPAIECDWPEAKSIEGHPRSKGDVKIGNDVWIGYGATILSGVTIGDGAVIGAKAVVAKDVQPYSIVVGNPAAILRKRFNFISRYLLQRLEWWNWSEEVVARRVTILCSPNVSFLIKEYLISKITRIKKRVGINGKK